MKSINFDSILNFDIDGRPLYDRPNSADMVRETYKSFIGNGVAINPSTTFKVIASDGMKVLVNSGKAWIEGAFCWDDDFSELIIENSNTALNRIDRVVLRLDLSMPVRSIDLYVITGIADVSPIPPPLTRNDTIYELGLADLFIPANSTGITTDRITDLRMNNNLCGVVHAVFTQVDATALYDQYQYYLNQQIAYWNAVKQNQANDWQNQMNFQSQKWAEQHNYIQAWYEDIRTAIFAKMQLNFDNWIYMPGHTYKTSFNADGSITERIANTLTDVTFCGRYTKFIGNDIFINIQCIEFELDMTKKIIFLSNGNIDEVITGTVGLLEPSGSNTMTLHNLLTNLSYETSNHTGFASSQEVIQIRQELLGVKENLQKAMMTLNGGE